MTDADAGNDRTASSLTALLEHDPKEWRMALDRRYAIVEEVLAA